MTSNTFVDDRNKHFDSKVNSAYERSFVKNEPHSSVPTISGKTGNDKRTLKLTEYRKTWIHKWVRIYGKQIGMAEHEMPHIAFTRREVLAMPKELTAGRRTVTYKYYGICFRKAKTILINVKKHRSFKDLKHTIVHELVHYRFGYLKHGTAFENRISLIRSGKKYKIKSLYIENPLLLSSGQSLEHQNQSLIADDRGGRL